MKKDTPNFKTMWQVLGVVSLIWGVSRLISKAGEPTFKVSKRSNCSDEFIAFSKQLNLTAHKKRQLRDSKSTIQQKIADYFRMVEWANEESVWNASPRFFIQGSYKHGTSIRTQDDTADIDLGVFFAGKPPISPRALQQNIYKALSGHTNAPVSIKNKCVRVKYANLFHIDLPVYYYDKDVHKYFFGCGNEWTESDPKKFTAWVKSEIQDNDQMMRLIRYFKAWSDTTRKKRSCKMPSGIAFTVWIRRFYIADRRDDVAFVKTACQIFKYLSSTHVNNWQCEMPVSPFDHLLQKLTNDQKEKFLKCLGELIQQCETILSCEDKKIILRKWGNVFGRWFINLT